MSPHFRDLGNPTHLTHYPYPVDATHPVSSVGDLSSSSVGILDFRRLSDTWMAQIADTSEGPVIRRTSETLHKPLEQRPRGKKWQRTTIEMLPEDILLEIFDFYRLNAMKRIPQRPWKWHRLAHVCRKWRDVISISPRRLDLRILCEYGASIGNILGSWPTLPLVVKLDASLKSNPMPGNVMVALRHPDRLCEIDLEVRSSMTGLIVEAIQKPCQVLERIWITVKVNKEPPLLVRNGFLGGSTPHLRKIKLDGIAFPFPAIRQVLLSTNNLIELHLAKIPNDGYFSPNDLVSALTTSVQLKRLTVGFYSPTSSLPPRMTPPQRTTLPSLTFFDFHGASEYLEDFVARIDLPALCEIAIMLFNDLFFEIPQFSRFIPRLNSLGSPTVVFVTHSATFVSVSFRAFRGGNDLDERCFLGTLCRRPDWQLSFATQISSQLSPLLSSVRLLIIGVYELPTGQEDVDSTQWLELLQLFAHVTKVEVLEKRLVPGIMQALVAEDMVTEVLPELTSLRLKEYRSSPSVAKAAEQFVATRSLSGRTITLLD